MALAPFLEKTPFQNFAAASFFMQLNPAYSMWKVGYESVGTGTTVDIANTNDGDLSLGNNTFATFIIMKPGKTPNIVYDPSGKIDDPRLQFEAGWRFLPPAGLSDVLAVIHVQTNAQGLPVASFLYNGGHLAFGQGTRTISTLSHKPILEVPLFPDTRTVAKRTAAWQAQIQTDLTRWKALGALLHSGRADPKITYAAAEALQDAETGKKFKSPGPIPQGDLTIATLGMAAYHQLLTLQSTAWSEAEADGKLTSAVLRRDPVIKSDFSAFTNLLAGFKSDAAELENKLFNRLWADYKAARLEAETGLNGGLWGGVSALNPAGIAQAVAAEKTYLAAATTLADTFAGVPGKLFHDQTVAGKTTFLAQANRDAADAYGDPTDAADPVTFQDMAAVNTAYAVAKGWVNNVNATSIGSFNGLNADAQIDMLVSSTFKDAVNLSTAFLEFNTLVQTISTSIRNGTPLIDLVNAINHNGNHGLLAANANTHDLVDNLVRELNGFASTIETHMQDAANEILADIKQYKGTQRIEAYNDKQATLSAILGVVGSVFGLAGDSIKLLGFGLQGMESGFFNPVELIGAPSLVVGGILANASAVKNLPGISSDPATLDQQIGGVASQYETSLKAFSSDAAAAQAKAVALLPANSPFHIPVNDINASAQFKNYGDALSSLMSTVYADQGGGAFVVQNQSQINDENTTKSDMETDYRLEWANFVAGHQMNPNTIYYYLGHADYDVQLQFYHRPTINVYAVDAPWTSHFASNGWAGFHANGNTTSTGGTV